MILTQFDRRQLTRKIFIVVLIGTLLFNLAVPRTNAFLQWAIPGGLAIGEAAFYTVAAMAGFYTFYEAYDSFKNESVTSKFFKQVIGDQWSKLSASAKEGWAAIEEGARGVGASIKVTAEQWNQALVAGILSFSTDRTIVPAIPLPFNDLRWSENTIYTDEQHTQFGILDFSMNGVKFSLMPMEIRKGTTVTYSWFFKDASGRWYYAKPEWVPPAAQAFRGPSLSVSVSMSEAIYTSYNGGYFSSLQYNTKTYEDAMIKLFDGLPIIQAYMESVYGGLNVSVPGVWTGAPTIPKTKDRTKPAAIPVPAGALDVPGSLTLNPADVTTAVKTMIGDIATDIPGTTTPDWGSTPSSKLNFEPLKMLGNVFTKKFPFSIPWDVMKQFAVFDVAPKTPVFKIDKQIPLFSTTMHMKFDIDFSMFEGVIPIVRWFLIIIFDLGLMMSLRRFMPE